MNNRRAPISLILVSVVLALTLVACDLNSLQQESQANAAPPPTRVAQAELDIVSAEGVVVPHRDADLSFKVPGRVEQLQVSEGDVVVAGQELGRLETRDLEQAVLRAEASLKSARAGLAKARAGARPEEIRRAEGAVAIAQAGVRAAEQAVKVAEGKLVSAQTDVQAAEDAIDVIQGHVAAAQARLSSAQASLNKLQAGATARQIQIMEKQVELAEDQLWRQELKRDAVGASSGQLAAAETQVNIAYLQLAKLKDPPRAEDVTMAQAQVTQAQADVATIRAQLAQAQQEVGQAQAGVQTAEAQLMQARAEVESAKAEAMKAQADLDLVRAGSRSEDIAVAEAGVAQAQAGLAEAQNAVGDAVLQAPFGGTVGAILVDEGELASAQMVVMQLGDLRRMQVETEDLSEVDIDQISVGQEARVTVDALGGEEFVGTVSEIASVATTHRGDTVYTVTIDLGVGPESGLLWGMSAFVEIEVR